MNQINGNELEPPSWIDVHFFEKVLKSSENCADIKIIDFTINPQKGDHFGSTMFRSKIVYLKNGKHEEISIIIKTMPFEDGLKKEILENSNCFETEIGMYSEVIPKFQQILKQYGDQTILGARMLYCSLDPYKVIVLEDITKQGYAMVNDRFANFEEMKIILEKICRWHAISFKLVNEGDSSLDKFNQGVFNLSNDAFHAFFESGINSFMNFLASLPEGQIYYEKFIKIKDTLIEKVRGIYKNSGNFCVLNHGDFHLKNIMTKFNEVGKMKELMLVDFQCCILAPLAIDLIYLLYVIIDDECRCRRDEVIYLYYTKFVDTLKKLEYVGKVPSLAELHIEIMKCKNLGRLYCIIVLSRNFYLKLFDFSQKRSRTLKIREILLTPEERKFKFFGRSYSCSRLRSKKVYSYIFSTVMCVSCTV